MNMNRTERRRLGQETVALLERGFYVLDDRRVDLGDRIRAAVAGTTENRNNDGPLEFSARGVQTTVEVRNESTLCAAARLAATHDVAVLNFASAKNPGGGFLNGSRAQEESLAMSSGLYACLLGREMYTFHRPTRGGMYTPWVVYSPHVPVFRDDTGALVAPYDVAFLTSPAVNAGVVLSRDPALAHEVREQMSIRIHKVLSVAAHHGHEALVLGAWGCGVFRNDPAEVAQLFADALRTDFAGTFDHVVFAVLDWSENQRFIGPFKHALTAPQPSTGTP